jgi:hypothetical protein
MAKPKKLESKPQQPPTKVPTPQQAYFDWIDVGPIRQDLELLLNSYARYEHYIDQCPEDRKAAASLFQDVPAARTTLSCTIIDMGLDGNLKGRLTLGGKARIAISLLQQADAEIFQHINFEMPPLDINCPGLGSIPYWGRGEPLRFKTRTLKKLEEAMERLKQESDSAENTAPPPPTSPRVENDAALKTIWYHGGTSYSIDGKVSICVPESVHAILLLFLDKDEALVTKQLGYGKRNVAAVMTKIEKLFGAGTVRRPGKDNKGAGYFIRVRSLKPPQS